jgi:hypothetical protein
MRVGRQLWWIAWAVEEGMEERARRLKKRKGGVTGCQFGALGAYPVAPVGCFQPTGWWWPVATLPKRISSIFTTQCAARTPRRLRANKLVLCVFYLVVSSGPPPREGPPPQEGPAPPPALRRRAGAFFKARPTPKAGAHH